MSKTVLVACKLPCGMILDGMAGQNSVELNGGNTALVHGAPGLTHVDSNEWAYLQAAYAEHPAFKNKSIFASGSDKVADALAQADELSDEKTGLEGLDPHNPGSKLKPQDDKKLDEQLTQNMGTAPRRRANTAADKAAALEAAQAKAK